MPKIWRVAVILLLIVAFAVVILQLELKKRAIEDFPGPSPEDMLIKYQIRALNALRNPNQPPLTDEEIQEQLEQLDKLHKPISN